MELLYNASSMTDIESWFIPTDIMKIIVAASAVILGLIFLFIIIFDKTCHTVPMMHVANSYLIQTLESVDLFGLSLFALENDLKRIEFNNSFCLFGGYVTYIICGVQMNSYLLQSIYRYITVVHPTHLFFQSAKFQGFLICLTWICGIIYSIPIVFTGQVIYQVDDQICQMPLRLSFITIFSISYNYLIPLTLMMLVYLKLVRYVKEMNRRIIPINTLLRAQRELRMIRRIISLVFMLIIPGLPYTIFLIMSFFNAAPKYHFRIAFIFVNVSMLLVMIALFEISEPLKISLMKIKNRQPTGVLPTIA